MNGDSDLILEVCVDSIESAYAAIEGGADRLELCRDLGVGGLTPSPDFVAAIERQCSGMVCKNTKSKRKITLFAMVRPRGGNFCYSTEELENVLKDIEMLASLECIQGIVVGVLKQIDQKYCIDIESLSIICKAATKYGLEVTFHRAFDLITDKIGALHTLVSMPCIRRILTSGCPSNVDDGIDTLKLLVEQAGDNISIMPGGGVRIENILCILQKTGATEIHGSFESKDDGGTSSSFVSMAKKILTDYEKI
jgi:copper homeostasis protein